MDLKLSDRRDDMRHAQSPIVLYTKLDNECDQQVTVAGRLLTASDSGHVCHHCQVLSTADDDYRIVRAVDKFSRHNITEFLREVPLFLEIS